MGARQGNLSPQVRTCEALARQLVYLYQMGEGVQINTQDVLPRNDRFALLFGALHRFFSFLALPEFVTDVCTMFAERFTMFVGQKRGLPA